MNASAEPTAVRPYEVAAAQYWEAGWHGVLPLPPGHKSPPPEGWTGWEGDTPSYADVQAWTEDRPRSNVGLRMPPDVLGVDVDQYKGKHGAYTLMACESRWVPLPPTWRSTSRDDGVSGIRFFKVPAGLEWPGILPGGDVELVHHGHRYACVSPSLHPEGRPYRWYDPDGVVSTVIPRPDELPPLPVEWIVGLGARPHVHQPRADMGSGEVVGWLAGLSGASHGLCDWMVKRSVGAAQGVRNESGSRHDKARDEALAIVRGGEQGHTGTTEALDRLRSAFIVSVVGDNSRTPREASSEWQRILDGAVKIVVGNPEPTMVEGDPCPPVVAKFTIPPRTRRAIEEDIREDTASNRVQPRPDAESEALRLLLSAQTSNGSATASDHVQPRPDAVDEPNSWGAVDFGPRISGQRVDRAPTFLARTDGQCMFYKGKINGIIGPAESGKTWLAMEAVVQALAAGHHVAYLDFEDDPDGFLEHCRNIGISDAEVLSLVHYINPDENFDQQASDALAGVLQTHQPALIVLDGINACMTLLGLDLMSNKDATTFSQKMLKPLARLDWEPCVAYLDHTPKNSPESSGGIGAQAKRAMTTGCCLKVEVITPFGIGKRGKVKVTVDKDRLGYVRGASSGAQVVGMATIDSDAITHAVQIDIRAEDSAIDAQGHFRPTVLMRRVCEWMDDNPGSHTQTAIVSGVGKNAAATREAIAALIREGYLKRELVGQRHEHTMVKMFQEGDMPVSPPSVRPTASEDHRDAAQETASEPRPSPEGTRDAVAWISEDPKQANRVQPQRPLKHPNVTINDEGQFIDLDTGEVIDPDELDKDI